MRYVVIWRSNKWFENDMGQLGLLWVMKFPGFITMAVGCSCRRWAGKCLGDVISIPHCRVGSFVQGQHTHGHLNHIACTVTDSQHHFPNTHCCSRT
jgi:hypothetical protein